jgi:hypothetical protein
MAMTEIGRSYGVSHSTISRLDIAFSRALLSEGHKAVKAVFPTINLGKDAWVWCAGRDHWEFHGPENYYWHGSAGNAFDARYKGWMAWLRSKGIAD